jgi:hypothetical protein
MRRPGALLRAVPLRWPAIPTPTPAANVPE